MPVSWIHHDTSWYQSIGHQWNVPGRGPKDQKTAHVKGNLLWLNSFDILLPSPRHPMTYVFVTISHFNSNGSCLCHAPVPVGATQHGRYEAVQPDLAHSWFSWMQWLQWGKLRDKLRSTGVNCKMLKVVHFMLLSFVDVSGGWLEGGFGKCQATRL